MPDFVVAVDVDTGGNLSLFLACGWANVTRAVMTLAVGTEAERVVAEREGTHNMELVDLGERASGHGGSGVRRGDHLKWTCFDSTYTNNPEITSDPSPLVPTVFSL